MVKRNIKEYYNGFDQEFVEIEEDEIIKVERKNISKINIVYNY